MRVSVCMHVCMHVCMYEMCVCVCVRMCVCMREKQTDSTARGHDEKCQHDTIIGVNNSTQHNPPHRHYLQKKQKKHDSIQTGVEPQKHAERRDAQPSPSACPIHDQRRNQRGAHLHCRETHGTPFRHKMREIEQNRIDATPLLGELQCHAHQQWHQGAACTQFLAPTIGIDRSGRG